MRRYRPDLAPLLVGHRGSRTRHAENTLEAIAAGAAAGATAVEIDARPCKSGEVVVMHDPTLERVTGGRDRRAIAALSLAELSRVELAGGERVPTLAEVLALCRAVRVALNVELKRDVPARLAATRAAAEAVRDAPEVVVSSFDPLMLGAFRALCPRVPIALLVAPERRWVAPASVALGAVAVHPHKSLVTAAGAARWHRRGLSVVPWTVNDPGEAEALLAKGVDGIISDDPAAMRHLFA
jgi:glycerophosphoryl diester phosphodiesterase